MHRHGVSSGGAATLDGDTAALAPETIGHAIASAAGRPSEFDGDAVRRHLALPVHPVGTRSGLPSSRAVPPSRRFRRKTHHLDEFCKFYFANKIQIRRRGRIGFAPIAVATKKSGKIYAEP